jgi:hypothetical protein
VLDWAPIWIDLGDPSTASQSLREQIKRTGDHLRARLLLAEAERALGDRGAAEGLEAACRGGVQAVAGLRVGCLLAASSQSRLAGEHQQAVRSARASGAELPDEPRLLASAAMGMAGAGGDRRRDEALKRAKALARETSVPIAWADMAVRLGRHQVVVPSHLLDTAVGPERRLVAARLILAYEGAAGLGKVLKGVPARLVLIDPDLHALSQIAEEGGGARRPHRPGEAGRRGGSGGQLRAGPAARAALPQHGDAASGKSAVVATATPATRGSSTGTCSGNRVRRALAPHHARAALPQRPVPRGTTVGFERRRLWTVDCRLLAR